MFLFVNGVAASEAPPISSFLETHSGAYTTLRTHGNTSCLLFWERHLLRLANSTRILSHSHPELFFKSGESTMSIPMNNLSFWDSTVQSLVDDSAGKALPIVLNNQKTNEELTVTVLVCGDSEKLNTKVDVSEELLFRALDVYLHIGVLVPPIENGARLAVVGRGRDVAAAKYSNWARIRKPLEKLRPPSVTELLLSCDGNMILEGCVTNFFVVRRITEEAQGNWSQDDCENLHYFEVQTAPLCDGVLPGIIRQVVMEVCSNMGIPLREVAPMWSNRETWEEAFLTNSLRLVQYVQTIRAPTQWESLFQSRTWKQVSWDVKRFKEGPGMITRIIQEEVLKKGGSECVPISRFV